MSVPFVLQPGESIVVVYRRHWIHLWPALPVQVGLALLLPILLLVYLNRTTGVEPEPLVRTILFAVSLVWGVLWLLRAYFTYYRYINDIWVLTNQRLVDSFAALVPPSNVYCGPDQHPGHYGTPRGSSRLG
jgi:hypothetical protein